MKSWRDLTNSIMVHSILSKFMLLKEEIRMAKIRVFTLNSNGKIELTKEELQQMLDESYRDGCNSVTITTPSYPCSPFHYGTTSKDSDATTNVATVTATNYEN